MGKTKGLEGQYGGLYTYGIKVLNHYQSLAFIGEIVGGLESPDAPSYTVTGSGGGGTHIYHYAEPRALTNRERARLQTFPNWYEFIGGKESVRRQIGMAVTQKGAKVIVEAILKTLAGVPYETEEAKWDEEYIQEILKTGENKKMKRSGKVKKKEKAPEGQTVIELEETQS
ncbi:DNA cytosine methyltransferase [Bacillus sp. FSL K6-1003]|uniref:DNA cytosine methyltransferase n=1 Tax=Bacillus sp. FSL K6-1003 TaxID=2954675 RepID=UPI0030CCE750